MRKAWIAVLVAALALASGWSGSRAAAQDMEFSLDETDSGGGEGDTGSETGGETGDSASGDVIGDLASSGDQTTQTTETRDTPVQRDEAREEIYAVQQVYALRINRVEVTPSVSQSLNDPFVSHTGIGLGLNYWWTNVLALGVNFIWYEGLESESELAFQVRRSTRLSVPINEYQFGAHLNFTYVPVYGKFSMFNEFIFQYDAYIVGGVGLMRTRPVPVVDPEVRRFDFDVRIAFNLGIGLRVFVTRWLAIFAELRDYMYLEQLEALTVQLGDQRTDPTTWTQSSLAFTNNVTAHLGLTIFLPPEFDYRLPR
ncbi:MAG: outer membrane beta-barrel domain-containing protein [Sandaracinaceae bacterium]|nr:outer membrane beta-barrel domain-containing protein [Sandaracinaceae bacterium]